MRCMHESDRGFPLLLLRSDWAWRSVSTITSVSTTFILDSRVFGPWRRMDSLILLHSAPLALCCIMASVFYWLVRWIEVVFLPFSTVLLHLLSLFISASRPSISFCGFISWALHSSIYSVSGVETVFPVLPLTWNKGCSYLTWKIPSDSKVILNTASVTMDTPSYTLCSSLRLFLKFHTVTCIQAVYFAIYTHCVCVCVYVEIQSDDMLIRQVIKKQLMWKSCLKSFLRVIWAYLSSASLQEQMKQGWHKSK